METIETFRIGKPYEYAQKQEFLESTQLQVHYEESADYQFFRAESYTTRAYIASI
jgi:hypothetical protein